MHSTASLNYSSKYTVLPIGDSLENTPLLNRLPTGVLVKEGDTYSISRDVQYRVLTNKDVKLITDEKFARRNPYTWAGLVISLVVDSIDGMPVYEEWVALGSKRNKIPEIVKEIASNDGMFLMYAGHIYNFGPELPTMNITCGSCGNTGTYSDLTLNNMMVEVSDGNHYHKTIELKHGYNFKTSETSELYHIIEATLPTIGKAITFEKFFRPNSSGDFTERVLGSCITAIKTKDGKELDPDKISLLGPSIINSLSAFDSDILQIELSDSPKLLPFIDVTCQFCSEIIHTEIQPNFLFRAG